MVGEEGRGGPSEVSWEVGRKEKVGEERVQGAVGK